MKWLHGNARAGGIAARLGRPQRVVVACRQARHFVPALLGAWYAGATVELLPNGQPLTLARADADPEIAFILHDTAELTGAKMLSVPDIGPGVAEPAFPEIAVRLTTSGTTGVPKRSEKRLAQLTAEVEVLATLLPPARAVLSTVPLAHIYGLLFGVLLPLRQGSAIVSHDALLLPADIAAALEENGVDRLVSTPSHLRALVGLMRAGLDVVSSGGRLPSELHLALAAPGGTVTDVFGSTETGGIATRRDPRTGWSPFPGAHVGVDAGDHLVVASAWCDGGGAVLEDRVAIEGATFRHLGRSGELVKIAGKRADAAAIEAAIRAVPGIDDVALVVLPPAAGREPRVALAVVGTASRADLVAAVGREFDAVFTPRLIRFVERIPRTDRGKLAAADLLALFPRRADAISLQRVDAGRYLAEVPADLVFFQGHFDGRPVLPGVALVDRLVWPAVRADHPDVQHVRAVRRLRFRRPIVPAQELSVEIERSGERVDFSVRSAGELVASGQLFVA